MYRYHQNILNWGNPIQAPLSITYNIINSFKSKYNIRLYSINESEDIVLKEGDIFIGHPWPDFHSKSPQKNSWTSYDTKQITNRVVLKYPNDERVFLLSPFNQDKDQIGWAIPLFEKTKNYIAICGDIWKNNLLDEFPVFKNCKFNQLNMALDILQYPFLKNKFNRKGERKFLYIGRISEEKNTVMLEKIAAAVPGFKGGYIAEGYIKGWKQIAPHAFLTSELMKKLAEEYDFFINTSIFDAQATTILEAMSWGFCIACTPQSGYKHESVFELSTDDFEYNMSKVIQMQETNEENLTTMQNDNKKLLSSKYSWANFRQQLSKIINN